LGEPPRVGNFRSIIRLPQALAGSWRVVRELESRGAEADLLIVTNSRSELRVAKIYRSGIEPKTEVLQRLGGTSFEHVVQLFDHGRSEGRWYELLEYVENGSLEDLLQKEGPKLDAVRVGQILVELLKAIEHLHAHDVVHRDLKPSNVLVRSLTPFDLILSDFGIASVLGEGSRRFTSGNRTIAYAAPEAAAGEVSKASDWWSLGIMLVEMLRGRHPFAGALSGELMDDRAIISRLSQMPVDDLVEGTEEPWRTLCRGLLRREARNRWAAAEIVRWVRRDPSLLVVEEVVSTTQHAAQFYFAGKRYGSLVEIASAFGQNWAEARKTIERGHFLNWAKDDLKDNEWRQYLSDLDRDCPDLDERLFRVILKLDPKRPPIFCEYTLDPDGLHSLADNAASEDNEAASVLRKIFDRRILDIAGQLTGLAELKDLQDTIAKSAEDYRGFCGALKQAGTPPSVVPSENDLPRPAILLAALPGGVSHVASLRQRANEAASQDARDCAWFRELADADRNSIAALLLMPLVASAAEQEAREQRKREQEAAKQRQYDQTYSTYRNAAGMSTGVLAGILVGFIPSWIFTGIVGAIAGAGVGWAWYGVLMLCFGIGGMIFGQRFAEAKAWVASPTRDPVEARTNGLLIAISSLLVTGLLTLYWASSVQTEDTKQRAAAQRQREAAERQAGLLRAQTTPTRILATFEAGQWKYVITDVDVEATELPTRKVTQIFFKNLLRINGCGYNNPAIDRDKREFYVEREWVGSFSFFLNNGGDCQSAYNVLVQALRDYHNRFP
jgi:serine/threonine protein kinase